MTDENRKSPNPTGIFQGYSPARITQPSPEEREEVGLFMATFKQAEEARRPLDHNWEFYKLYLQGNQLIGKDLSTGQTVRIQLRPEDAKRLLSMENLLRPTGRALIGKLMRVVPIIEVLPRTDDVSEIRSAMLTTSVLEQLFDSNGWKTKYKQAQQTLLWCGTSVWQLAWDRTAGSDIAWCKTCGYQGEEYEAHAPCPQCTMKNQIDAERHNQMGQEMMQTLQSVSISPVTPPPPAEMKQAEPLTLVNEGDITISKLDTREFYPEPGVWDHTKFRFAFVRKPLPVSEARRLFNDDTISAEDGIYTDRSLQFYGNLTNSRLETTLLKDHVYVYEGHEVGSAQYPEGRIVSIVNSRIKKKTPNFYWKILGRLPFYYQWFERNDGEFWGEPPLAQSWHIQRERNRLRTQKREHRELGLRPRLMVPQGTKLGMKEIDTTPGRIFQVSNFGNSPKWLDIQPMPDYVYAEEDKMAESIRLQFGVTEQEIGMASGDQSGRFAAILEAQSTESIGPIIVENQEEVRELARGMLLLGQRYYTENRVFTITGSERVRSVKWGDIRLRPGADVALVEQDSLSKNPAIRKQEARELLGDGAFTDQRTGMPDMRVYLKVAGVRIPGMAPDVAAAEHAYAAAIPELIARGMPFQPKPWDDARICVEELVAWLRGPGRGDASPDVVNTVGQVYLYYLSLMPVTPLDASITGNPTPLQPGQQGPQQQTVGLGAGAMPKVQPAQQSTVANDAADTIQNADKQGEQAARGSTKPHEG